MGPGSGPCRALVTGGSMGIGFHAAEALARLGCRLVLCARRPGPLKEASEKLSRSYGVEVSVIEGDLRSERDVKGVVLGAIRELGALDVVFLSYGNPTREPLYLHEAEWSDWMEAASLYVASTATILKLLVQHNPAKSTVIIVSSFTVIEPAPPLIVSDTLRAGLSRLVRVASRDYPEKIRPILLLLGSFDTPGARETIRRLARRRGVSESEIWEVEVAGISPLKRLGGKEELVSLISFLARSPEYLSGSTILFDGATTRAAWP